jgi:choline dehydrogenase-like flavoprotein
MIINILDDIDFKNFPVVIFGSGPAGITTALELEKKNIKSLIVEAGSEEYSDASQEFYKGEVIGDEITDLSISRLRQFGGTSGHWGGWSKPRERYNYDLWPINVDELDSYIKRTCEILDIKNQFGKSSLNNFFNQIEFKTSQVNFADKYKNHIKKSNKISLILDTQLSHFVGTNNNTDHAVCISKGKIKNIASKYFILACGGIENSRILLWSREQNKKFITNGLPIGKYWMNHPYILSGSGAIEKKKLQSKLKNNFLDHPTGGNMHFATKKELQKEKNILSANIFMKSKEDLKLYKEILRDILCVAPEYGNKIIQKVLQKDLQCGNIYMQLEEEPIENNRIVLSKIKDKNNLPLTKLFYKKSKKSLKTAKLAMEEFANLCRKEDLGRIALKKNIYNLDGFENLGAYHHMGGTRMGINEFDSVVDGNLKVHNINNLYVSGSSTFVTGGYTNPTFAIIQFSLRLADEIKKVLKV